jgi:preprotein translocase subunit YajC
MLGEIAYAGAFSQGPNQAQGTQQMPWYSSPIFLIVAMIAVFYFLLIRPQQKRQKEHRQLLENLKKGDKVMTTGGIQGTIVALSDNVVTVEIADKVKVKVGRNYIGGLMKSE